MFRGMSPKSNSQDGQIKAIGSNDKPNKMGAKILLGVLVVGLVGELVYLNSEQPENTLPQQQTPVKAERKVAMNDVGDFNLAGTYPFWLDNMNGINPSMNPSMDGIENDSPDFSGSPLPSGYPSNIPRPNIPRPNIPDLPSSMPLPSGGLMPAIPHNDGDSSGGSSSGAPKVTGLILGNGGSDSVAIISDGAVVKTGQKYNGNTVTSISEHGITFEDGTRMNYK